MNTLQNLAGPSTDPKKPTLVSATGNAGASKAPNDMSRKSKKNDTNDTVVETKNPRALNSFIAFRTYYAPIFVSLQQKHISSFLTYLWANDFDQSKWFIIARAYSIIRDSKGKNNAPLNSFLAINAPFMGISKPGTYFVDHGWAIVTVDGGCLMTRRTVASESNPSTTIPSVNDVLRNSYAKGYVGEILTDYIKPGKHTALMMAISPQPIVAQSAADVTANNVEKDGINEGVRDPMSTSIVTYLNANEAAVGSPTFPIQDTETVGPRAKQFVDGEVLGVYYPEQGPMTPVNGLFPLLGEHPFNNEFMPTTDRSAWDPSADDQFDAYHMSEVNDSDNADWFNHFLEQ